MCGIAGYFGLNDPVLLSAMAARIAHRGPDGEGFWLDTDNGVGLAHRRLAIVDQTAAASQPMASCSGRYKVIFNGEIYNFREIAKELSASGYIFNRNSDTAVLGPLYDQMGAEMLSRIEGIFVFAIWDASKRELFVARDAFGVKPLYFARPGGGLLFASELKALLAYAGIDKTIDVEAIADYLVHLWSPGRRTPLRGVSKLLPGHYLRVGSAEFEDVEWYRPASNAPGNYRGADAKMLASETGRLFDAAVSSQCMSDVPIGAFLSGGVDSSAIVASMVAGGNAPTRTYSIGFEGPRLADEGFGDDLVHARRLAINLGVPLSPIFVKEPTLEAIEVLVNTLDEPQADPAPLFVSAISQAARADGIKVLLSGTGGDDIFSGYRRHKAAALRARLGGAIRLLDSPQVEYVSRAFPAVARRRLEKLCYMFAGNDEEFLLRSFEFNPRAPALNVLSLSVRTSLVDEGELARANLDTIGRPLVDRILALEGRGFLPDHNLNYTDKASMAHGVEVRVPFLDRRLVDFAREIPWTLKTTWFDEKWIFKQSQANRLPREILDRAKTGFGAPVRHWIAGSMCAMIADLFSSRSFRERGLFDLPSVDRLLRDTVDGRRDGAYLVFAIVMVELWMRNFIDQSQSDIPESNLASSDPRR
jgi:asparagine synthase (glutamine-hydrolysing)